MISVEGCHILRISYNITWLFMQLFAMSTTARNSHCFVPGCKTGYRRKGKSESEVRCSLFSPSHKNLLLWKKAIPRADKELSLKDRICELHFDSHHIIREDKFTVGSETVILPRVRPLLHTDAVPCIYPNLPQYLSRHVKPRRTLVKHSAKPEAHTEVPCKTNNGTTGELSPQMSFSDLINCHLSIAARCPPGWATRTNESVVCFGKIVLEENCLQCTVCVSISSKEQVSVFYRNRKLSIGFRLQTKNSSWK